MKTSHAFFSFVVILIQVAFKYEEEQRKKTFFFFSDWRRKKIIVSPSKEEYQKGNYVSLNIYKKEVFVNHYYFDSGKKYHLQKQSPLIQPNMLSGYDRKKCNKINGNLLEDPKSGQGERDLLMHQIFCYVDRLGTFSKRHSNLSSVA